MALNPFEPIVFHCPHCEYDMPPAELVRKDGERVICSRCKGLFVPEKRDWKREGSKRINDC